MFPKVVGNTFIVGKCIGIAGAGKNVIVAVSINARDNISFFLIFRGAGMNIPLLWSDLCFIKHCDLFSLSLPSTLGLYCIFEEEGKR